MKILVWNVRRATKKRIGVWEYFQELEPDVALLQEVASLPSTISSQYAILEGKARTKNGSYQKFNTSILVKGSINGSLALTTPLEWVN